MGFRKREKMVTNCAGFGGEEKRAHDKKQIQISVTQKIEGRQLQEHEGKRHGESDFERCGRNRKGLRDG